MILILLVILFTLTFILIKSADVVVISLRRLAKADGKTGFVLAALLLALATSFPELFVGITSALEKSPSLSIGIVLGSNIANISIITGIAALITGKVVIRGEFMKKDLLLAFFAGLSPLVLAIDGNLTKVDGLVLLAIYGAYASSLFQLRFFEIAERHKVESFFHRLFRSINHVSINRSKEIGRLCIGIALLLFSADSVVKVAQDVSMRLNIPIFVMGVIILAIGTSLPELAFSLRSLEDKEPKMFLGNLLGSTIVNSTLIVGISVLIHPIEKMNIKNYGLSALFFLLIYLTFWYFIRSKMKLERWEALILLLFYIIFAVLQFA